MHGKQRKLKSTICVTRRYIVVTWLNSLSTRIGECSDLFQDARALRIICYGMVCYGMVDQPLASLLVHLIFVFFCFSFLSFLHA